MFLLFVFCCLNAIIWKNEYKSIPVGSTFEFVKLTRSKVYIIDFAHHFKKRRKKNPSNQRSIYWKIDYIILLCVYKHLLIYSQRQRQNCTITSYFQLHNPKPSFNSSQQQILLSPHCFPNYPKLTVDFYSPHRAIARSLVPPVNMCALISTLFFNYLYVSIFVNNSIFSCQIKQLSFFFVSFLEACFFLLFLIEIPQH